MRPSFISILQVSRTKPNACNSLNTLPETMCCYFSTCQAAYMSKCKFHEFHFKRLHSRSQIYNVRDICEKVNSLSTLRFERIEYISSRFGGKHNFFFYIFHLRTLTETP